MPKARGKGHALDKGPSYACVQSLREDAQLRAAMSSSDDFMKTINEYVQRHELATATRQRFLADARRAVRRCSDGPRAILCDKWSKACPTCRTGRTGDQHHIFERSA